jgi:hypothetical protein
MLHYQPHPSEASRHTVGQHLRVLEQADREVSVVYRNTYLDCPDPLTQDRLVPMPQSLRGERFDAVILHYTFLAFHWDAFSLLKWKQVFQWVADLPCLKAAMPQDEADHAELLDEWLVEWGVDVVFSVLGRPDTDLYPLARQYAKIVPCLTGYIDEAEALEIGARLLPPAERQLDLVYRARALPYRYGTAGRLKALIGDRVAGPAIEAGLRVDISTREADTIFGSRWIDFLASSKATLGCESGFTVIDRRGEIKDREAEIMAAAPDICFADFAGQMPRDWNNQRLFAVSPRHLEAAVTKTCQVLIEGSYEGILQPNRHYIPLKPDFSNLDEVLQRLRDVDCLRQMTETAYAEVVLGGHYSYRNFANRVYDVLADRLAAGRDVASSQEHARAYERRAIAKRHHTELQVMVDRQRVKIDTLRRVKIDTLRSYRDELDRQLAVANTAVLNHLRSCEYILNDLAPRPRDLSFRRLTNRNRIRDLQRRVEAFKCFVRDFESRTREWCRAGLLAGEDGIMAASPEVIDRLIDLCSEALKRMSADSDGMNVTEAGLIEEYQSLMPLLSEATQSFVNRLRP